MKDPNIEPGTRQLHQLENKIESAISNTVRLPEDEYRAGLEMFAKRFPDFPYMIEVFEDRRRQWLATQN